MKLTTTITAAVLAASITTASAQDGSEQEYSIGVCEAKNDRFYPFTMGFNAAILSKQDLDDLDYNKLLEMSTAQYGNSAIEAKRAWEHGYVCGLMARDGKT